jgi:hypothetical protein
MVGEFEAAPLSRMRAQAPRGAEGQGQSMKCQFFLRCKNEATTTREHPILGTVACCVRCATWYDELMRQELRDVQRIGKVNGEPKIF